MQHHEKPSYREDCRKGGMCPAVITFNPTAPVYCDITPGEHVYNRAGLLIHRGTRVDGEDSMWTDYDSLLVP